MTPARLAAALLAAAAIAAPVATAQAATDAARPTKNLVQLAQGRRGLSTLVSLIRTAGLVTVLSRRTTRGYTLLAPTNRAFARLGSGTLKSLRLVRNRARLRTLLLSHVLRGRYLYTDFILRPGIFTTLSGRTITVTSRRGAVRIGGVTVAPTGLQEATNGFVHTLDGVLG